MNICKFGGSSVQHIEKIDNILKQKLTKYTCVLVIVSAFGNTTDLLLTNIEEVYTFHTDLCIKLFGKVLLEVTELIQNIKVLSQVINTFKVIPHQLKERLLSYGELLSSIILYHYFNKIYNCYVYRMNSENIIIKNLANTVNYEETTKRLNDFFSIIDKGLIICPGYICSDVNGNISTLGRGGSDYTASIIGSIMNTETVELWTDVDGILTSDPRYIQNTKSISHISYNEMSRIAHYGANVIYTPTIYPLSIKNIPLVIKNTFNPTFEGTIISEKKSDMDIISVLNDIILFKIYGSGLIGNKGVSSRLFTILYNNNINIILIAQTASEYSIYVVVHKNNRNIANYAIKDEFKYEKNILLTEILDKSIVTIETKNIKCNLCKMSKILINNNINPSVYTINENNICFIVNTDIAYFTVNLLHNSIFNPNIKNLYIIGTGLVGTSLLKQIKDINSPINENVSKLVVIGTMNSRTMTHIKYDDAKSDIELFINHILTDNLNNKVVVDCTASDIIHTYYEKLLMNHIAVVTPNKRGNTQSYSLYKRLTSFSLYKYETTVGAGLPIINTLHNLLLSGDEILEIEGVLSGTLSYIFTEYNNTDKTFVDIVKQAQELGYTEPNPLDDLSGVDVMRKILILARISGIPLELNNVNNISFLTDECNNSKNLIDFYNSLSKINLERKQNKQIRHVASLKNNQAVIEIKYLDKDHPFTNLQGSDNMIIITTKRYLKNPIIIQGPGAGAEITSAGILADIMQLSF
jgi:bifunctional aspartokinase / homoserine dehydrogenase 1